MWPSCSVRHIQSPVSNCIILSASNHVVLCVTWTDTDTPLKCILQSVTAQKGLRGLGLLPVCERWDNTNNDGADIIVKCVLYHVWCNTHKIVSPACLVHQWFISLFSFYCIHQITHWTYFAATELYFICAENTWQLFVCLIFQATQGEIKLWITRYLWSWWSTCPAENLQPWTNIAAYIWCCISCYLVASSQHSGPFSSNFGLHHRLTIAFITVHQLVSGGGKVEPCYNLSQHRHVYTETTLQPLSVSCIQQQHRLQLQTPSKTKVIPSLPPCLCPPPLLYLMICLGMDERRRVSILGMQERRRTVDTLLGLLWPFGGTVLTRSKRTLFSLHTHRSSKERTGRQWGKRKR